VSDQFITFRQVFTYYSNLDFNKVIFGGKLRSTGFLILNIIIAYPPAYFISELAELVHYQLKTPVLLGITILITIAYYHFFLNPYVKKQEIKNGIKTKKGFPLLKYRDFQLKKMDDYLTPLNINTEKKLQQLINRAHKKADGHINYKTFIHMGLLIALIVPFWNLTLSWIFKNYIDPAEDTFQKLIEVSQLVGALITVIALISFLFLKYHHQTILNYRNKYLNFAGILEDILLSKTGSST